MTKPIGIYVRVSRKGDREDERFHSPKEQAERAEALVRAKGFVPGRVFEDIDVSGATTLSKRPAMAELLAEIKAGRLGGVAAYSLDRLSREPAHGDALVKIVTKAGGVVLTPDIPEAIDSPTGEFTFGMLLQVAKLYRSTAGARFASAKERSIKAGIPVGPTPVGYRQRPDRTLEPDPELAPTIRELFEKRAAGATYTPLANLLAERSGRTWTLSGVARVLRNRVYATGRLEYGDVVSDVATEPLVDEPLWHAAQDASTGPRPKRGNGTWLLTGLLRCACCGKALSPWTGGSRRRADAKRGRMEWVDIPNPQKRYRCRNRSCEERANVNAERLERWVVLQTFAVGDELATRSEAPDLGALEEAVESAGRRLAQVMAPEARDALGELWAADVKTRRLEHEAALARLGEARQDAGVAQAELRLREVWEELDLADRREAMGLFWKAIRVGRGNGGGTPLTFVARGPQAEAEVTIPPTEERG